MISMDNNMISIKIKEARLRAGLTQKQLAAAIGCTQKDISRWEAGKPNPSIKNLKKIAYALNTKIEELL